jgi:hypothetical protein
MLNAVLLRQTHISEEGDWQVPFTVRIDLHNVLTKERRWRTP